ncbi:hypothetical protein ACE7GA_08630 [Roseomonas sp. CCTCC AB2023176]|uniref:hypothetical protein n=1 Tax=Roseomonas sp. CCTCC AB2023176 TaxID=3342640 RepID=UPI0035DF4495
MAGLIAALAALTVQKAAEWLAWVAGFGGIPLFLAFLVILAPVTEEPAKWLARHWLRVPWGAAGLAFGVWEAVAKLGFLPWHAALPLGALGSLALHWGLGRLAGQLSPVAYALAVAILLHAAFNLVGGGALLAGAGLVAPAVVTLTLGGALLVATRARAAGPSGNTSG